MRLLAPRSSHRRPALQHNQSGPVVIAAANQKTRGLVELASNGLRLNGADLLVAARCSTEAATSDRASPPSKLIVVPRRRGASAHRRRSARAASAPRSRGRAAARGRPSRRRVRDSFAKSSAECTPSVAGDRSSGNSLRQRSWPGASSAKTRRRPSAMEPSSHSPLSWRVWSCGRGLECQSARRSCDVKYAHSRAAPSTVAEAPRLAGSTPAAPALVPLADHVRSVAPRPEALAERHLALVQTCRLVREEHEGEPRFIAGGRS